MAFQTLHIKELEKEEQTKPKISIRKEITDWSTSKRNRKQKNNRRNQQKLNAGVFFKRNKINKPLARLRKKRKLINKIRNERRDITIDDTE